MEDRLNAWDSMSLLRLSFIPHKILCILVFSLSSLSAFAATEVGFNAGEFLEKAALSKVLGNSSSGWFLPFHFTFSTDLSEKFQFSTDLIYRKDTHGSFSNYDEYLVIAGIGYRIRSDLTASFKIGGGKAVGTPSGEAEGKNGGVVTGTYSCTEVAAQVSVQTRRSFSANWDYGLGGGLLLINPTDCENEIAFSPIGILVHRAVPIFNWDLIYRF